MRYTLGRVVSGLVAFGSIFLVGSSAPLLNAQWLNYPAPGMPHTRDGKPDLAAPAPRALDGKPDLSGVWIHETTTVAEVQRIFGHLFDGMLAGSLPGMELGTQHKYGFSVLADFPSDKDILRPEAIELYHRRFTESNPADVCGVPAGFPLAGLLSEPIKIVQSPRVTMVLYEVDNLHRQIFTDGRELPKEINLPAYLGYSAGHWERDTLLVQTAGFNDKTHLDLLGHPHSDALHISERFHRRDFGHLEIEMTIDDPKAYLRPFTITLPYRLLPDQDIFEMFCNENEKDGKHMRK